MATYSGQAPEIMSPRQFGGVAAIQNSSMDPSATNTRAAGSGSAVQTLATVDQAARKTSAY